jgi:hypothetical protein
MKNLFLSHSEAYPSIYAVSPLISNRFYEEMAGYIKSLGTNHTNFI